MAWSRSPQPRAIASLIFPPKNDGGAGGAGGATGSGTLEVATDGYVNAVGQAAVQIEHLLKSGPIREPHTRGQACPTLLVGGQRMILLIPPGLDSVLDQSQEPIGPTQLIDHQPFEQPLFRQSIEHLQDRTNP